MLCFNHATGSTSCAPRSGARLRIYCIQLLTNSVFFKCSAKSAVALLVHDRVLSMSRQGVLNIDKGDRDAAM